jgi:hypothetical protein
MSQTYASRAYAPGGQDEARAGGVIIVAVSILAGILVIAGLIYATGTSARHKAAVLAAGCEPTLFISGLPCTTQAMVIGLYQGIVPPAIRQLAADTAAYRANEKHNLVAAQAALTAAVATEQALDNTLATVADTPQNRARALRLITGAEMIGNPVPSAAVTFTPQSTVIADALIQASQALARLTAQQARSTTLTQLRSFNTRVDTASAAVQTEMNLLHQAVNLPLTAG